MMEEDPDNGRIKQPPENEPPELLEVLKDIELVNNIIFFIFISNYTHLTNVKLKYPKIISYLIT